VDGGVYFSDWAEGWDMTGKGRLYRMHDPAMDQNKLVLETRKLIAEGMDQRPPAELARLLAHQDMRVRQAAQFALAERGPGSIKTLLGVARDRAHPLARLHAIWGLGQIARANGPTHSPNAQSAEALTPVVGLLADSDAEVRAQAAKTLGEVRFAPAGDGLEKLLADPSARVRFFAALGVGKLQRRDALPAVAALLRENADADPYLRHAAVMALTGIGDMDGVMALAADPAVGVRMGALLTLRRWQRAEIARFLNDPDPALVLEAARAINDQPINGADVELAGLIGKPLQDEALLRRVINANRRHGTPATAQALAEFAARTGPPASMQVEALKALGEWAHPSGRDPVIGCWRPIADRREAATAMNALRPQLVALLGSGPEPVRGAMVQAVSELAMTEAGSSLALVVTDGKATGEVRAAALRTLAEWRDEHLAEALKVAQNDSNETLRLAALRVSAAARPGEVTPQLVSALEKGSVNERQQALDVLGTVSGAEADRLIAQWLDELLAGKVPPAVQLDVLEAAQKRSAPALKERLDRYRASLDRNDPLAEHRVALEGGDAAAGRLIFLERADVACARCHKFEDKGGDVGPDLKGVGGRQTREYILESVLFPNAKIAAGFETTVVNLKNDESVAGIVKSEDANELVLNTPDRGVVIVKKSEIQSRDKGLSAMPEGLAVALTKKDLRNLVEFLGTAK